MERIARITSSRRPNGALGLLMSGPLMLKTELIGVMIIESHGDTFEQIAAFYDGLGKDR